MNPLAGRIRYQYGVAIARNMKAPVSAPSRLPERGMPRQAIFNRGPSEGTSDKGVVTRADRLGIIEAAGRDIQLIQAIALIGNRRPAVTAETSDNLGGGSESFHLTLRHPERFRAYRKPGNNRSAARAPAKSAMAQRLVHRRAAYLIPYRTTLATA